MGSLLSLALIVLAFAWIIFPIVVWGKLDTIAGLLREIRNRLPEQPKPERRPEPTGPFAKMRG